MSEQAIRRRLVFGLHTAISMLLFYLLLQLWIVPVSTDVFGLSPTLHYIVMVTLPLLVVIEFTGALMIFLKREQEDREKRKRKVTEIQTSVSKITELLPGAYTVGDDGELIYRKKKR